MQGAGGRMETLSRKRRANVWWIVIWHSTLDPCGSRPKSPFGFNLDPLVRANCDVYCAVDD
jgi:hypothetical protein